MRIVPILCASLWLLSARWPATAGDVPTDDEIRMILQNFIERDHWGVGMVVGIVDEQGTRVISYGKLDNGDSPEVNGDTLFEIGSITKTFTALLLQDMVARGEMKLDDPVDKFLPASVKVEDPAWGVVKHLRVKFRAGGKIQTAEVKEGEALRLVAGAEVVEAVYGNLPVANQTVDVTEKIVALTKNGELNVKADKALGVHEVHLKVPGRNGRKITLLDLATHTSGFPKDGLKEWTFAGLYDFLSRHKLRRKPGTEVEYSNLGFVLLGHAIESKASTNYEALVQERICRPLHMDSTCILPTPALRPRWAKSHGDENRAIWDADAFYSGLGGAGALRSSANDMLKYVAANLGLTNSPLTPLMEKTHAVQVPQAFETFGKADLAMPWWIFHREDAELITHGGATGQKAFIGFDKKLKRGVVVLANRTDAWQQAVEPLGLYLLHPPAKKLQPVKVAPEILDAYAGLYQFPEAPEIMLTLRRDGNHLITQLLNAAGGEWYPLSDTEFANPWGEGRMKLIRSGKRTTAVFTNPLSRTWRARKISDHVPDSLFQPMLQPLSAGEYAPRKDSDLQGTWKGTIRPWYWPFVSRRGTLNIAERAPGVFRAELNVPAEHIDQLPIAVIYHAPGVELVIRSGGGMFKGKINAARTKMTGHLIQGKHSIGITLRRAEPKADAPAKPGSTNSTTGS